MSLAWLLKPSVNSVKGLAAWLSEVWKPVGTSHHLRQRPMINPACVHPN